MKKRIAKKLSLNRETIQQLERSELRHAEGAVGNTLNCETSMLVCFDVSCHPC